jgi:hypothetical protein
MRAALWLGAVLVPLAAGWVWVRHTDLIKQQSAATIWLTSEHVKAWVYGTWSQRVDPNQWLSIWRRLDYRPLLGLGLLWAVARLPGKSAGFVLAMLAGAVTTTALFFNLYAEHDYYSMAWSPAIALLAGLGLYVVCFRVVRRPWLQSLLLMAAVVAMGGKDLLRLSPESRYPVTAVGEFLAQASDPSERLVIEDYDWNPEVLYYSRRRGLMWDPKFAHGPTRQGLLDALAKDHFTMVASHGRSSELLYLWEHSDFLGTVEGFQVYRVSGFRGESGTLVAN